MIEDSGVQEVMIYSPNSCYLSYCTTAEKYSTCKLNIIVALYLKALSFHENCLEYTGVNWRYVYFKR